MKTTTDHCSSHLEIPAQFCREIVDAVAKLRIRLLAKYEGVLPGRSQLIRQAVAEAEEEAWELPFPHLFLPDLAEARVERLVAARTWVLAHAA
jgi:hypothetical protein